MLIRRKRSGDEPAIGHVHAAAFRRSTDERGAPPEVALVDDLRATRDWLARLSLVAVDGGEVIGHVLCSRARLARGQPVLDRFAEIVHDTAAPAYTTLSALATAAGAPVMPR